MKFCWFHNWTSWQKTEAKVNYYTDKVLEKKGTEIQESRRCYSCPTEQIRRHPFIEED